MCLILASRARSKHKMNVYSTLSRIASLLFLKKQKKHETGSNETVIEGWVNIIYIYIIL